MRDEGVEHPRLLLLLRGLRRSATVLPSPPPRSLKDCSISPVCVGSHSRQPPADGGLLGEEGVTGLVDFFLIANR